MVNSQFNQKTDIVVMGGPAFSTTEEIYMQAHEKTTIFTEPQTPKFWRWYVDDVYFILKRAQPDKFLNHVNNLNQNNNFITEKKSKVEVAFFDI